MIEEGHKASDLYASAAAGKFITKKGYISFPKLQQSAKIKLAELYTSVNACLEAAFGYKLHASHGTLLGLVREGDLIANDDDFDCAYVSKFATCAEVSQERFAIADHLRASGFDTSFGVTGHIKIKTGNTHIDLMPAWFDSKTYNVSSFSAIPMDPKAMFPLQPFEFCGAKIFIPAKPEEFLRLNYGEGWRVPDPFYRSTLSRKCLAHRRQFRSDQAVRSV